VEVSALFVVEVSTFKPQEVQNFAFGGIIAPQEHLFEPEDALRASDLVEVGLGTDLIGSDLTGVGFGVLTGSDLGGSDLTGAGVGLGGSDLTGVGVGSDLTGVGFDVETDLIGAGFGLIDSVFGEDDVFIVGDGLNGCSFLGAVFNWTEGADVGVDCAFSCFSVCLKLGTLAWVEDWLLDFGWVPTDFNLGTPSAKIFPNPGATPPELDGGGLLLPPLDPSLEPLNEQIASLLSLVTALCKLFFLKLVIESKSAALAGVFGGVDSPIEGGGGGAGGGGGGGGGGGPPSSRGIESSILSYFKLLRVLLKVSQVKNPL